MDYWMDYINTLFLIGALLIGASILASSLSSRLGMPLLLVFLIIGMLAGVDGPGRIVFDNVDIAFMIGNLALAIILLDGGMRTRVENFRVGLWPALSLASFGVLISAIVVGLFTAWILGLHWMQGLLLGAIVGSTDAAAVFSLLQGKGLNLKQRVGATLEIESGSNDPMAIFLTITLVEMLQQGQDSFSLSFLLALIQQFGIGGLCGIAGGFGLAWLVNRVRLASGLYALLITSGAILVFSATNSIGGSGFLAIYLTGLVLGNRRVHHLQNILHVQDGMAWLSQIGMFLMLGLLVTPSELLPVAVPAILIALFLIFVARPIAVLISLAPFRFSWRERLFISWVGLRGAVPIILALFPLLAGLEQAQMLFNLAFVAVLVSLLLQGSTLPLAARLCRVEIPPTPEPLQRTSLDIAVDGDYELMIYQLDNANWCVGSHLRDLKMPADTRIAALFRQNHLLHPSGSTRLALNDVLCVVGRPRDLAALSKLFSTTHTPRHLENRSFFGDFILQGDAQLGEVGRFYGFAVPPELAELTLASFFSKHFGGHPVVGDSIQWEGHTWVVAAMDNDWILKIGLKLGSGSGKPPLGF
jgi:potassium/hydrogen antiporter